jgi:ABC-type Na+ efflux pump permease subunit
MTNRIIIVFLFTLFSSLIWLYLASYHSTVEDWWTVLYIEKNTSEELMIATSPLKVMLGMSGFILMGLLLSAINCSLLKFFNRKA